ncbi:hypothetical protein ACIQXV_15565 [Neobacillus sp. NPDC097160]|uniref:hypothetical protein n=1 Tax=Neobacillus sp. NPDC097160 TaxID=3364298 RepID=UPI0038276B64
MIKITFDQVSVLNMRNSSGIFIGKQNTHKNFRHESVINEVVGTISGNENWVNDNEWIKNKENWEEK